MICSSYYQVQCTFNELFFSELFLPIDFIKYNINKNLRPTFQSASIYFKSSLDRKSIKIDWSPH